MPIVTTIEVNGLMCRAHHGVMPQERAVGNDFAVTVHIDYPAHRAVMSDELSSTVNYAELCDLIKSVMDTPSQLLEHVCGRMHVALMERFPMTKGGFIRIEKLSPPISGVQMHSAAVSMKW